MANPFKEDNWDWPFILYAGMVFLNYSEDEVWNLTPRKFKVLLDAHYEVVALLNGSTLKRKNEPFSYIDKIPGW